MTNNNQVRINEIKKQIAELQAELTQLEQLVHCGSCNEITDISKPHWVDNIGYPVCWGCHHSLVEYFKKEELEYRGWVYVHISIECIYFRCSECQDIPCKHACHDNKK